jgi:negative regulator of replication initiation
MHRKHEQWNIKLHSVKMSEQFVRKVTCLVRFFVLLSLLFNLWDNSFLVVTM